MGNLKNTLNSMKLIYYSSALVAVADAAKARFDYEPYDGDFYGSYPNVIGGYDDFIYEDYGHHDGHVDHHEPHHGHHDVHHDDYHTEEYYSHHSDDYSSHHSDDYSDHHDHDHGYHFEASHYPEDDHHDNYEYGHVPTGDFDHHVYDFNEWEEIWHQDDYESRLHTEAELMVALEALREDLVELDHDIDALFDCISDNDSGISDNDSRVKRLQKKCRRCE